jgi:(1->4)-alpha-D-glucan 1-alpha-D-glucosylmutase
MQKAMREAKVRTSWVSNDEAYEKAVNEYIDALLDDAEFTGDMAAFVQTILRAGRINSLTQTLLKYTAPGVPDLYQGGELWDLSLVDPDNRRPVDYALRERFLKTLKGVDLAQLTAGLDRADDDGLPKLWLVRHALQLRNEHPEWFGPEAAYTPIVAAGPQADRVIAYRRGESVVTVAQRWPGSSSAWEQTTFTLPAGRWMNRLSGERIEPGNVQIATLLQTFPVALLVREEETDHA